MLPYPEFEARLLASVRRHHLPIAGALELTYRCNFACVHCFQQDARDQAELGPARWTAIIDQIAAAGCLWLTITGGEATLHPDFAAIYEHAIRRGLLVTVFTNGSTLADAVIELFVRLPPRTLEISLYGASPATYAQVTGEARRYEAAMAGVRRAVGAGLAVHLKTMVFDATRPDLEAMQALASTLGAPFRFDTLVHATLGRSRAPSARRLPPQAAVAAEALAVRFEPRGTGARSTPPDPEHVYRCGAGRFAFTVAPDGFLQACTLTRGLRFDLSQIAFADAWAALGEEAARRYSSPAKRCAGCAIRQVCGTCPGVAELETGDPEAAVPDVCAAAHLRAARNPERLRPQSATAPLDADQREPELP
ncbi:MAG: radical SAM protein [Deltaproteobacteria bacterium]|nr:radical SAM protein [Deltaproteobacteria bacterium]